MHISDSHLGFSAYRKVDESTGINQREMDIYNAFQMAVDQILSLRPDAVVHAGDLFDSVRPSNRAISFALEQLLRLSDAGIPVVVIAGNHSTPRLRETGSVFKIFDHIENVHPIYQGPHQRVELDGLAVHAVPHSDPQTMTTELLKARPKGRGHEVLVLHAAIASVRSFSMGEFNEAVLPDSLLREDMDYIALGHYHKFTEVTRNAAYSGSTERLSFTEAKDDKGFLLCNLDSGERKPFHLDIRPMLDLPWIDAKGMSAEDIALVIKDTLETRDLEGAVVRLNVTNLRRELYRTLDFRGIYRTASAAMHLEPHFLIVDEDTSVQSSGTSFTALDQEFDSFLSQRPVEGVSKERIRQLGLEYLNRGLEPSD